MVILPRRLFRPMTRGRTLPIEQVLMIPLEVTCDRRMVTQALGPRRKPLLNRDQC